LKPEHTVKAMVDLEEKKVYFEFSDFATISFIKIQINKIDYNENIFR